MIQIRESRIGMGAFAARPIKTGEVVLKEWGSVGRERTRHSIQVDDDIHVTTETIKYFNHSCEPNCGLLNRRGVAILEVHSLRGIESGEELTLDYATFECRDLVLETVRCLCDMQSCRQRITGYADLPVDRRKALQPFIAEYLHEPKPNVS